MRILFRTTILAVCLAATIAAGIASAAIYVDGKSDVAAKADRLPVAERSVNDFTIETRSNDTSVLTRFVYPSGS